MEEQIKKLEEEIRDLKKELGILQNRPHEFHYHVHVENANPLKILAQMMPEEDDENFFGGDYSEPTH